MPRHRSMCRSGQSSSKSHRTLTVPVGSGLGFIRVPQAPETRQLLSPHGMFQTAPGYDGSVARPRPRGRAALVRPGPGRGLPEVNRDGVAGSRARFPIHVSVPPATGRDAAGRGLAKLLFQRRYRGQPVTGDFGFVAANSRTSLRSVQLFETSQEFDLSQAVQGSITAGCGLMRY
jgi:hypothetical protein